MIAEVSQELAWSQLIARAWTDDEFKQRLQADPRGVLAEHGIDMPEDVEINIMEDTKNVRHIILPPPPAEELMEEDLAGSAAYCYCGGCYRCGRCGCGRCY